MNIKQLVSHRGDKTNFPENTYKGIEAALSAGALFVEFDVQMNADHSLVVLHDTDFKRTANNPADLFEIGDTEMNEISVHEPHRFKDEHYPTPVSTLSEVMDLVSQYPKAKAFVEIKRESIWRWGLESFMTAFLDVIKDYETQAIVISFGMDVVEYTKANSTLFTGFVFDDYQTCNRDIAEKLKPEYLFISHKVVPKNDLWKGSWKWAIYSLNNIPDAIKILKRGDIDMIETDDISLLIEAIKN